MDGWVKACMHGNVIMKRGIYREGTAVETSLQETGQHYIEAIQDLIGRLCRPGVLSIQQTFSVGNSGNVSCQIERLFLSFIKLAILLVDQKTYVTVQMAQENEKVEMEFLWKQKGNFRSDQLE